MALDYTIIGSRLKQVRLKSGLTQEDLAEKLNVSIAFLSRIECGKCKISLKRLNQVCALLGIDESYILSGSSTDSANYLNEDLYLLLNNCPPEKIKLIYNVAKTIIET